MAPEPISMVAGKKAIEIAIGNLDQLFKEATDKNKKEVERCASYLEACSEAIRGSENEYDEILVQVVGCHDTAVELKQLRERILEYLHVDTLRGKLCDVIKGLTFYQSVFEQRASSLLQWPWKWADRDEAVRDFAENLKELNTYLARLSDVELPYRPAGTGVGQEALHAILQHAFL